MTNKNDDVKLKKLSLKTAKDLKKRIVCKLWEQKRCKEQSADWEDKNREFDPGSGLTLAACVTHASRTVFWKEKATVLERQKRVANGWVTREQPAFHKGIAAGNGN